MKSQWKLRPIQARRPSHRLSPLSENAGLRTRPKSGIPVCDVRLEAAQAPASCISQSRIDTFHRREETRADVSLREQSRVSER